MKKLSKEEVTQSLEARIALMQSIIDAQNKGLELSIELVDSSKKRNLIQSKIIDSKDEIIEILERQKAALEKENQRLNIAIGIFLFLAFVFCAIQIFML
jgi:hypothetical protein